MGEIAAASEEQHTGIEQVNRAVAQMDEVTQQNAALVEEASAAAQSMAVQSGGLRDVVGVFRIGAQQVSLSALQSVSQSPLQAADSSRKAQPMKPAPAKAAQRVSAPARKSTPKPAIKPVPKAAAPAPSPVLATAGNDQDWETF
jgi:methyl-accepting chemotaxis protein